MNKEFNRWTDWPQTVKGFAGLVDIHYRGWCIGCGGRTYSTDTNDPRGMTGEENTYYPVVASEYGLEGETLPACYHCMNIRLLYDIVIKKAKQKWSEGIPQGELCLCCGLTCTSPFIMCWHCGTNRLCWDKKAKQN